MIRQKRANKTLAAIFLLAIATVVLAAACGSDSSASGGASAIPRVVPSDRIYTTDDLKAAGAKTVKDYDVEDLPGAIEVWHAVFNRLEYEARFYESHEDAVAQGTIYADSVTGEDAVVTGDDILWEEGSRDRRKCSRAAQTPHSSCSYSARYLEYVIRGNLILFCEGDETAGAFANCDHLLTLMDPDPV